MHIIVRSHCNLTPAFAFLRGRRRLDRQRRRRGMDVDVVGHDDDSVVGRHLRPGDRRRFGARRREAVDEAPQKLPKPREATHAAA